LIAEGFIPKSRTLPVSDTLGEDIARAAAYSGKRALQAIRAATCFQTMSTFFAKNRMPTAVGSGGNAHGNAHRYRQ
jgi:hypothetical protein